MMDKTHTTPTFDHELNHLFASVMEMGALVEFQLRQVIAAARDAQPKTVEALLARAREIQHHQDRIARGTMLTISRRQLAARDLRLIMAISHIAAQLQDIGDEILRVAYALTDDQGCIYRLPACDWQTGADQASHVLNRALSAFERLDMALAESLLPQKDQPHPAPAPRQDALLAHMAQDPSNIAASVVALLLIHAMHRIAEHASAIAQATTAIESR